ncbi:sensor histidine kinase [Pseudonocardia sp. HH130630-07]|uniref:sensor histidine kinase n=1 Tax=Pseudonocardia sp. HH130630-07 TaxID=1690815 RepID=UPI000814D2A8|nr:ATP-binding protein [Pseudonocardia sp. HH130630-07]ANY08080.1 histidine kinase [Pseudonocardia sp. HH130630-07]
MAPGRLPGRARSLRARLVGTVLLVFAVACAAIGIVTTLSLDHFLSGRQDRELVLTLDAVAGRVLGLAPGTVAGAGAGLPEGPGGRPPPADGADGADRADSTDRADGDLLLGPGQGPGAAVAVFDGDRPVRAERAGPDGTRAALSEPDVAALGGVARDAVPHPVALQAGSYQAAAYAAGDRTVVVARPDGAGETVDRLLLIELVVLGGAVLLAGLAAAVLVRRELRPLERVAGVAARVGELPLDRGEVQLAARVPEPDPRTEVGQVGTALNRMLDNVEGALAARQDSETRLRRFVADASHELRTPLAAIRGYAELSGRESAPVPPGTAHALRRITSQAERMSALVEDLLLLARLDAGRPLARSEVDLTRLVLDGIGDAHVAGPGHRWVPELPGEPVTVTGDPDRLAQVLANLLANARTHTPDGTTVRVRLDRPDPGRVRLSVTDDGPGIDPAVLGRVFERFTRAAEGRARAGNDTPGTGLGLAIVAAVVTAHEGTVGADSRAGHTTFTVQLPTA